MSFYQWRLFHKINLIWGCSFGKGAAISIIYGKDFDYFCI